MLPVKQQCSAARGNAGWLKDKTVDKTMLYSESCSKYCLMGKIIDRRVQSAGVAWEEKPVALTKSQLVSKQ